MKKKRRSILKYDNRNLSENLSTFHILVLTL
jgi:hypothetical protein